jgi:two-component system sensor kinase FixL
VQGQRDERRVATQKMAEGFDVPDPRPIDRVILLMLLVIPIATAPIAIYEVQVGRLSPLVGGLLAALVIAACLACALRWAAISATHEHAARIAITRALDTVAVALVDSEGVIMHWSAGCERLYGWTAEYAVGRSKYALLQSSCDISGTVGRAAGDRARGQELREYRRDGSLVEVIERVHRLDGRRRDSPLVVSIIDVSSRRAAETALIESEARLALAMNAHEVAVFEADQITGQMTWSAGTEQRLGLQPGSINTVGDWRANIVNEDRDAVLDSYAAATAKGAERFSFGYRLRQPNGVLRTLEGSAHIMYDERRRPVRAIGVIKDVTERDRREAELYAREAQLRSILEAVPTAMIVVDAEGVILSFSTAAERLFGYAAHEISGTRLARLSPADLAPNDDFLASFFSIGPATTPGVPPPMAARRADGSEFPLELNVGEAWTGREHLFTAFIRDISERLATEERLADLNAEFAHVGRTTAMGELAAGLAHELNQPLAATANFLGAAELILGDGGDASRIGDLLQMANSQVLRAGDIIRRSREFVAKRDVEMRVEPVEAAIRDAVALVLVGSGQFDIRLRYDLDPEAGDMLADRVQIQQVLVNLLRNAIEVLRQVPRDQREIVIATHSNGPDEIEISITDTGPGLPQAVIDRLYTAFVSTKGEGGLGLGLSICKRIVEAHGGELCAENAEGGGAIFRFTVPRMEGDLENWEEMDA